MTALKWHTDFSPGDWLAFDGPGIALVETALPANNDSNDADETNDSANNPDFTLPESLPILPLRGLVVYPLTAVPLTVGQPRSIKLVDDVVSDTRLIGLVASKDADLDTPAPKDLYKVGTVGIVHRLFRAPDGTIRLLIQALARFRTEEYLAEEPYLRARVTPLPEHLETGLEVEALSRSVREMFQRIAQLIPSVPNELVMAVENLEDPRQLVYTIATYQRMSMPLAQELLELDSVTDKLKRLMGLLTQELDVLELGRKIQTEAQSEIEKVQREYFLREQLKAIQRELGERDEQTVEVDNFRARIARAGLSEEAKKEAERELERLAKLPPAAAEYGVIRTYLDTLVALPWAVTTEDNLDLKHARAVLEADHYGLSDIKERILEFLAVRQRRLHIRAERANQNAEAPAPVDFIRKEREGVVLCFVGPPGVGKTSLGQSIARALNRKFVRMSLGGMRDEAEIRGHRRTYIGAMPGRIMQMLRRVESKNPVFMLDEIDKLGSDFRGDPSSALLEALDPEQNREFRDHYLDVAFDLSQVMFIATANTLETIPGPLRDRMEIVHLSSYTEGEKLQIARHYLIPRQILENGLKAEEIAFEEAALRVIIRNYTREAGVRNLERQIGGICRKLVTRIAEGHLDRLTVTPEVVYDYLGKPLYFHTEEVEERTALPGVAIALAYTPVGGDIMFVEATQMPGNKGFQLTGQLGEVMQESARAALSYVRANSAALGLPAHFFDKHDLHIHVPAGATPKDGPSAGVTIATALVSLALGRPVRKDVGMTGEITLRGQVLPIGGVKEKALAAHRAGLKTVILPRRNEKDLVDVPDEVRQSIRFVFADRVDEVIAAALEPARKTKKRAPQRKKA